MLFFNNGYANDNCFHLQLQLIITKNIGAQVKRKGNQLCTLNKNQKIRSKTDTQLQQQKGNGYRCVSKPFLTLFNKGLKIRPIKTIKVSIVY
ncbi:hypothetical protein SAMN05421863_102249 [Nitrosomonas communis]|uniref:Uncharacterized protein n=1 Tax=Nitrosomonas communis TaxID=44574 RepID=A0A1I4PS00_9PROT|nr:hypothetical protein SAMN05421863_102249 [Nitrosomonas communis]